MLVVRPQRRSERAAGVASRRLDPQLTERSEVEQPSVGHAVQRDSSCEARGALTGVRVLDVTQVMAGPFCAMQLCDMGADVIKIEPPGGDSSRRMAGAVGSDSPSFNAVNRGKRGVVIDLKTAAGQAAIRRLIARTDILIETEQ